MGRNETNSVTGREIVYHMMRLGQNIARWNRQYSLKEKVVQRLNELGLTQHQVEIMGFLHANPECNTISALSAEILISKGSLSLMLSKLKLAGFVEKKAAEGKDDGRKVYLSLTEKGEAALKEIMNLLIDNAAVAFDEMDAENRALFYAKVKECNEIFQAGGWKE